MAGDASDNIPGVKGIGEKGACKLLDEFKSLEGIYKHVDQVTPAKLREKLMASKQEAFLSKELATLETQVPLDAVLDDLVFPEPDRAKLFALFNELEFRKFAQEYAPLDAVPQGPVGDLKTWVQDSDEGQPLFIAYDLKSLRKASQSFVIPAPTEAWGRRKPESLTFIWRIIYWPAGRGNIICPRSGPAMRGCVSYTRSKSVY